MTRHGHLHRTAINAIATESTTECRDYPNSASSTTKLRRRKYGMMTQRRRQRLHSLRTTLHTINFRSVLSCRLTEQRISSPEIVTSPTVDDSTVIFATRQLIGATCHLSTRYSSSTHLCDMSLVDTLLIVNPSLRHVTRRHVIRHQLIVRNATTASTLRYGPSNHRQCQVDRFSIAWYQSVRHAVARTTTITGSTTDKPYPSSHSSNKTSPSSQAPGFAPPARG